MSTLRHVAKYVCYFTMLCEITQRAESCPLGSFEPHPEKRVALTDLQIEEFLKAFGEAISPHNPKRQTFSWIDLEDLGLTSTTTLSHRLISQFEHATDRRAEPISHSLTISSTNNPSDLARQILDAPWPRLFEADEIRTDIHWLSSFVRRVLEQGGNRRVRLLITNLQSSHTVTLNFLKSIASWPDMAAVAPSDDAADPPPATPPHTRLDVLVLSPRPPRHTQAQSIPWLAPRTWQRNPPPPIYDPSGDVFGQGLD